MNEKYYTGILGRPTQSIVARMSTDFQSFTFVKGAGIEFHNNDRGQFRSSVARAIADLGKASTKSYRDTLRSCESICLSLPGVLSVEFRMLANEEMERRNIKRVPAIATSRCIYRYSIEIRECLCMVSSIGVDVAGRTVF